MALDKDLAVVLKSSMLGDGEPDLGEKLLRNFLTALLQSGTLPARVICLNSGIFLTTHGSPVADVLQQYADAGVEILSCRTCLEYYGRLGELAIGSPTDMNTTVQSLLNCDRVIAP
jgi:selenium metabolism protein YedF